MKMKKNILLCDIGGTHARFAKFEAKGEYSHFKKYCLNDFQSFEYIVEKYHDETGLKFETARFSVARTPMNGRIEYQRHAGDPDYIIDFNVLEKQFGWSNVLYLNDLEAAAYGVNILDEKQTKVILKSKGDVWNNHKIIISVGTGVGHAGIFDDKIMRTCGGHWLPVTVTDEHRAIEQYVRNQKDADHALIMEDFVSGRGLRSINEYYGGTGDDLTSNTIRLFFEFLGLYAHTVVSVTGFYGGVYLTGGVIDHLVGHGLVNWEAFEKYLRPAMVSVVEQRLHSTPINYVLNDELPLLGLTVF